jgi:hypothetical protein
MSRLLVERVISSETRHQGATMAQDLSRAGVIALFGMFVSLLPLVVGLAYMLRPSDRLLELLRPLSLATIFAAIQTLLSGLAGVGRHLAALHAADGWNVDRLAHGLTEAITPMFVAFGFLAAAWLCVAVGMRRQA